MKKTKLTRSLLAACSIVALSAVMYGCVHSSDDPAPPPVTEPEPEPEPTAYEAGKAAIMAATTAEAAQAAYDAVDQTAISGAEAMSLSMALTDRLAAIAKAARIEAQKMALSDAAGMIDTSDLSTAELIGAANAAIGMLEAALAGAADLTDEEKAMYQTRLETAQAAVREAQTGLDTAGRMAAQRMAIMEAVTAARTAVGMVNDDATDAEVMAADTAVAALKTAIDGAADLDEGDADVVGAQATLTTLEGQLASAKESRTAAMAAAEKERREQEAKDAAAAAAAMAATAAKLIDGISMPTATDADTADTADATGTRFAQHAAADGDNAGDIEVAIGDADNVFLSEDEDAMVADNHGWEGKRYTRTTPASEGTYEAYVYSNVGAPMQGDPFDEEYTLADGALTIDTTGTTTPASRVGGSSFDHSAGVKTFMLPNADTTAVRIPGSYHGVSGQYRCVPGAATAACAASVTSDGFELGTVTLDADGNVVTPVTFTDGGGTWTFTPSNADARVMDVPDANYASYGWWLHKAANDGDFTASAFVDEFGTVAAAVGLDALNGTATYRGGAAGKYALSSSTGGTNDAGHFTARATLEANFNGTATTADAITGTIDMFIGADGMSRDWSVKLNGSTIGDTGVIGVATEGTEWTIDGTAADDAGNWAGSLRNNGDDGVPQVATGTFYSTYGSAGKMVGAFGANKQ